MAYLEDEANGNLEIIKILNRHFTKKEMVDLVSDLQQKIKDIKIEWIVCKQPNNYYTPPTKIRSSDVNDANMVRVTKNDAKIFDLYMEKEGKRATMILFIKNNLKEDLEIVCNLLTKWKVPKVIPDKNYIKYSRRAQNIWMLVFLFGPLFIILIKSGVVYPDYLTVTFFTLILVAIFVYGIYVKRKGIKKS